MAAESTTHIFTSLYNFTEAAKYEMVEKFKEYNTAIDMQLEHTHDDLFILRCPKDDNVSPASFMNLLSRYVSFESEKEPDMFENSKVKRKADTLIEVDAAAEEQFSAEDAQQEDSELIDETDTVEDPLIPHETFSRSWSTKIANPHPGAGLAFSKRFLEIIGDLTGCRVELEPDGNNITAKGENLEEVSRVMLKLDFVDRWAYEKKLHCPRTCDFQYSEGEVDILLQMRTLKELKDGRLNTTLVPLDFPFIKNLGNFLTIIMIKQGVEVTDNQSSRPTKQCLLWKDHGFKFREDESADPPKDDFTHPLLTMSSAPPGNVSAPIPAATVDEWVQQLSGPVENPFSPPATTTEHQSSAHEAIAPPPVDPPAQPRRRFGKSRKPMGFEVEAHVPVLVKDGSAESTIANSHVVPPNTESDIVSHENLGSGPSDVANTHSKEITASEDSLSRLLGTRTRLQSLQSNRQRIDAPPIEPPFMPTETNAPTGSEFGGSDPSWEKQLVSTGRAGLLIDDSLPIKEMMQSSDEVQTRQLRRTMNQRKSGSGAGNSKSSFAVFLKDFELATTSILELAQNCQGPIKLRVEIGRILINPSSGSSEFKKKPFTVDIWPRVFPSKQGISKLESHFTNMLTTSSEDAQFVLSLKSPSGRKMFAEEPSKTKVTYCFECLSTTNDRVVVEVDERGRFKILCNEYLIGALNWHFPRRLWDARLSVTSSEQVSSDIRKSVKEMVNNLCFRPSPDRKTFDLTTKIELGDLRINSITVHMETRHSVSEYDDIQLHLLQVRELSLLPQKAEFDYQASLLPTTGSSRCNIWWEVSLSSDLAEDTLKQNEMLELGGSASWTPEQVVSKPSLKNLCSVARDLVERIDIVGSSNKGPIGSGTKSSDKGKLSDEYW